MKAKFVLLIAAGLFLVTVTQAQFPGSFKDNRDGERNRSEITYDRNEIFRDHQELRNDHRALRQNQRQMARHKRHHHHHGHRHAHGVK